MSYSNYHSHSNYCDGKGSLQDYVTEALSLGMKSYGFSSHCPIPYQSEWSMKEEDLSKYMSEILFLKEKYKDSIELYVGLELDYFPEDKVYLGNIQSAKLDFSIGSIHFIDFIDEFTPWEIDGSNQKFEKGFQEIFNGNIQNVVKRYFELTRLMVRDLNPTIVGHIDKLKIQNHYYNYFLEQDRYYQEEVFETIDFISQTSSFIEVNTRGLYKNKTKEAYPSAWILKRILEKKIPIVLNSDSHATREIVAKFDETTELLKTLGFKERMELRKGVWKTVKL